MTTDPNEDLIGYSFKCEDGLTYRVTHTWDGPAGYVLCHNGADSVIRQASVVRRAKQLDKS